MIIFCDLDGTVADCSHRLGFIQPPVGSKKDWVSFLDPEFIKKDTPIPAAVRCVRKLLSQPNVLVYFLTGRPEKTRQVTEEWLCTHISPENGSPLLMRGDADYRPAEFYKQEHILKIQALFPNHPAVFIDDEARNIQMFQNYGLVLRAPGCWDHML